jgi:hypothetical protein
MERFEGMVSSPGVAGTARPRQLPTFGAARNA